MGTEVQYKMYLPGYYSLLDVTNNAGKASWPLHHEKKSSISGQYHDMFLTRPYMDGYEGYDMEKLRQTILKHEAIFRHQLHELHHLYKIQRDLMNNIKGKELQKDLIPAGTSHSFFAPYGFSPEEDNRRWHAYNMPLVDSNNGRQSTSGMDSFCSQFNSVKRKINDHESLESKCNKLQRRIFDLELPADEYINSEAEKQGVSGVSGVQSFPPKRDNEVTHERDGNWSIRNGASSSCNTETLSSHMYLRRNSGITDLNEPFQVEEASALASIDVIGSNTCSKEEMPRQDSSASAYSGFRCLPKDSYQNPRKGRDGIVSNLHLENKSKQEDQLSYPFESGKTIRNRSSLCGNICPEGFPMPCVSVSSQVEPRKADESAMSFPSDQNKTEQRIKRTIFGVEISERNHDSSVLAFHTLRPHTTLVPKSDVANSESSTISPWTKPPCSLSLISTEGNLCFNTSPQSNKSSITLMQSPEVYGDRLLVDSNLKSIPDITAEASCQTDVHLGSHSDSNKLQGCHPSVRLGLPNGISGQNLAFGQFLQHEPQRYLKVSGCMVDVKSEKERNTDAVSQNNQYKVISQQNLVSDWSRNQENSQGGSPWLQPVPHCNGKYSKEREGSDDIKLGSLLNYSQQFFNKTEMRKDPSQSFMQDSSSADAEHGKIVEGDCSSNGKILGFPMLENPHILKDLPSSIFPSKPSCLSSIDNGNPVNVGLVKTDLTHDPMSPNDGELLKLEDMIVEKGLVKLSADSRYQIDLNICVTEEQVLLAPSSPTVKIATEIDLEAPVIIETDIGITPGEESPQSKSKEPFVCLQDESMMPHEGLISVAAEVLVAISSSDVKILPAKAVHDLQETASCHQSEASLSDSLHWLAEIISSYEGDIQNEVLEGSINKDKFCHGELIPDGIDFFEFMTLTVTETKAEHYCDKPQILENPKDGENTLPRRPRRGQTRRGRQQKDFQRDILPTIAALSRNEVTEDLQMFEGLITATGGSWHAHRSKSGGGRGRRCSGVSAPSPTATAVCLPQVQQPKCSELGLEERSLTGWGKRTRRPPRQRCQINNPLLPPK